MEMTSCGVTNINSKLTSEIVASLLDITQEKQNILRSNDGDINGRRPLLGISVIDEFDGRPLTSRLQLARTRHAAPPAWRQLHRNSPALRLRPSPSVRRSVQQFSRPLAIRYSRPRSDYLSILPRRRAALCDSKCIWRCPRLTRRRPYSFHIRD